MKRKKDPEVFYGELIGILLRNNAQFMIGGTYAFTEYTGIVRPTKDIDILCAVEDYPNLLKICNEAGYKTELHEANWIAKVHDEDGNYTDIIYAERNGLQQIDKSWYERAQQGMVLGHMVKLVPVEELIRSKAYIQFRERHDGADIVHLILKHGKTIDWKLLLEKIDWEILFEHLLVFTFVYPSEKENIPQFVFDDLLKKAQKELRKKPINDKVTRGLLISSQYEVGITKWGYKPVEISTANYIGNYGTKKH